MDESSMPTIEQIVAKKFKQISPYLHEKALRIWSACEALSLSRGGVSILYELFLLDS
jgi:hypothetical protein